MGVLYDVLFKPIGRGDGSTPMDAADRPPANDGHANNGGGPPEWVLDERDGGSLVWRRYGATESCRRRVEFLDAVEVRVYERDDYGGGAADVVAPPSRDEHADEDGQLCWADDFSTWDDDDDTKTLFYRHSADRDDYPVLVAVSVTVLGLCIGLAYVFAPVKWLLHQLLVD